MFQSLSGSAERVGPEPGPRNNTGFALHDSGPVYNPSQPAYSMNSSMNPATTPPPAEYSSGTSDFGAPSKSIDLSPSLRLPYKTVNEVWSIYGKRGSGKSYFLGKVVEELNRHETPFIIIDVKGAHNLMQLPNLHHVGMTDASPTEMINRLGQGDSLVVSCRGYTIDQMREFVTEFCNTINRVGFGPRFGRPVVMALEECHNFVGQGSGSAGGKAEIRSQCLSAVDKLIREGRQDGVGAILISQSVANVLANIRRQAEMKIIFNLKDHTDIKNLRHLLIGKSGDDVGAIIERVYNFGVGEFVCVSPTYIDGSGIIIDKTSPRSTEHAGRSFIEDGDWGSGTLSDNSSFIFEPEEDRYQPIELDDDVEDEPVKENVFGVENKPKIDMKSAIGFSLLGLSIVGIVAVVIKKYLEKKELEKEQEIEERLKSERRKLQAMKVQQNAENEGSVEPQAADVGEIIESFSQSPDFSMEETPFDNLYT